MKVVKRLLIALALMVGALIAYSNHHQIALFDYDQLISQIEADLDRIFPNQEDLGLVTEAVETESNESAEPTAAATTDPPLRVPANPFSKMDSHARNTPNSAAVDIQTLANHLGQQANTDLEKARAIYVWLAENIAYDDQGYNSGNYSSTTAEDVLTSRKSVCDGYSNLYLALGRELGLDIEKVTGYAKGYGYRNGADFASANHAWNVIQIAGQWRVFDATWGSGNGQNVNGRLVSKKAFTDVWFNVDPYDAIFSHYPEEPTYAFVSPHVSLDEYEAMPRVDHSFFSLVDSGRDMYAMALNENGFSFPEAYPPRNYVKAISIPLNGQLTVGQTYDFEIHVPNGEKVAVIDAAEQWTFFNNNGGRFTLSYDANTRGMLRIGIKRTSGPEYDILLEYDVSRENEIM